MIANDQQIIAARSGNGHAFSREASNIDTITYRTYYLYGRWVGRFQVSVAAPAARQRNTKWTWR